MTNESYPVPNNDLSFVIGGQTAKLEMIVAGLARIEKKLNDLSGTVADHGTRLTKLETELETLKTVRRDGITVKQAIIGAIGIAFSVAVAAFTIFEKTVGAL